MSTSFNALGNTPVNMSSETSTARAGVKQGEALMDSVSHDSERMSLVNIFAKFMKKAHDTAESTV